MSDTTFLSMEQEIARCREAGLIDAGPVVLPEQRSGEAPKDAVTRHGELRRSSCWNPETCWNSHTGGGRRGRPRPGRWLKIGSSLAIVQHYEGCWDSHSFPVLMLDTGVLTSAATSHTNKPYRWRFASQAEIAAASGRQRKAVS